MKKYFLFIPLLLLISCDKALVYEKNIRLQDAEWNYAEKPSFMVNINDTDANYNIYVNLRFEAEYAFSNIFFLFSVGFPDGTQLNDRIECVLFDNEGLPLGKGIGDMYFVRYKMKRNMKFHQLGEHRFMFEQNMRADHLKGIHDLGIRIEKEQK